VLLFTGCLNPSVSSAQTVRADLAEVHHRSEPFCYHQGRTGGRGAKKPDLPLRQQHLVSFTISFITTHVAETEVPLSTTKHNQEDNEARCNASFLPQRFEVSFQ
jgi:Tfp pilus assembly protein PilE